MLHHTYTHVYVCVYIYLDTHTHTHTHTYAHIHIQNIQVGEKPSYLIFREKKEFPSLNNNENEKS